MPERKIIQIAVNDGGTTCLTDDGRVWYWTTVSLPDGYDGWYYTGAWKEIAGPFIEDESRAAPSEHGRDAT